MIIHTEGFIFVLRGQIVTCKAERPQNPNEGKHFYVAVRSVKQIW